MQDYVIVSLNPAWTYGGKLNTVRWRGNGPQDAVLRRVSAIDGPHNSPLRFVVTNTPADGGYPDSWLIEWSPPAEPAPTAKVVTP